MRGRPRLAVFDVDGTLTATNAVDDECFLSAVSSVLGITVGGVDYGAALHATDSYLCRWLSERHRGHVPSDDEVSRVTSTFVDALRAELARAPHRFVPIAGAPGLFDVLRDAGWAVAIATGGWGASARLKLAAAGLDEPDLVVACASDAMTRTDIVGLAIARAAERAGRAFERVVSVGDRPWDARTAAAMGLPFVGVATGPKAAALYEAGATTVVADFTDRDAVQDALAAARPPIA